MCVSDLVLRVGVGDFQRGHGPRHGLHGGEDVLVDALGEAPPVLLGEAAAVDDPHLANEGGLAALPGACTTNQVVTASYRLSRLCFFFVVVFFRIESHLSDLKIHMNFTNGIAARDDRNDER